MKRRLWILVFAKMSITRALAACHFIERNISSEDDPLYYPLVTAIFVLYARPFGNNKGVGALPGAFSQFSRPELLQIHQLILYGRKKFYAHLDANLRFFDAVSKPVDYLQQIALNVRFESDGKATVCAEIIEPRFSKVQIPKVRELCEVQIEKLKNGQHEMIQKLFSNHKLKDGLNLINVFDES